MNLGFSVIYSARGFFFFWFLVHLCCGIDNCRAVTIRLPYGVRLPGYLRVEGNAYSGQLSDRLLEFINLSLQGRSLVCGCMYGDMFVLFIIILLLFLLNKYIYTSI